MPRVRLSDGVVRQLGREDRPAVIWDTELWGFGCSTIGSGDPFYFAYFRTRTAGLSRRVPIGRCNALTCEQARAIARDLIGRSAPQQFGRTVCKEGADPGRGSIRETGNGDIL